jgi:hypothetical protein
MSGRFVKKSSDLCVLPGQVDAQVRSKTSAMYCSGESLTRRPILARCARALAGVVTVWV